MTLKVRDAGGVLRTITTVRVRDGGGILREIVSWKIRDGAGVLREIFTSGGGGGGGNPMSITPGSRNTESTSYFNSKSFTAYSSGGVPSSYSWGVLSGPGSVTSGATAATAQLGVYADADDTPTTALFYCDAVIAAVTYRATCSFTHTHTSSGGGFDGPIP